MTDYTKSTNFTSKDSLLSGNPLKIVKGAEIDTEFNNIATAIATKTDNASAAITGGTITGITDLAVADGGTGASTAANARTNLGAAASGSNSDITALSGLTTALSVAQGGTGKTSATANSVLLGNGTSALQEVAPSTANNVLKSNGTTWVSASPWNVTYVNTSVSSGGTYNLPSNCIGVYIWSYAYGGTSAGSTGAVSIKDSGGNVLGTVYINGTNFNNGTDGGSGMSDGAGSFIPCSASATQLYCYGASGSATPSFIVQAYVTI